MPPELIIFILFSFKIFNSGFKFFLSETEIRAVLRDRFKAMESRIISYHVYVGKNFLLKVAVKFVGASIGLGSFKLHNSIDQAKKYIDEIGSKSLLLFRLRIYFCV